MRKNITRVIVTAKNRAQTLEDMLTDPDPKLKKAKFFLNVLYTRLVYIIQALTYLCFLHTSISTSS